MINQNKQRVVALLPMKAHSSRVPGKNFRDLCGKPLYRWILDTLLDIEEIDNIIINTDARDILEKSKLPSNSKILIRDRPKAICGDEVSMNKVIQDDITNIDSQVYLMTHTTNPFLSVNTIKKALSLFDINTRSNKIDSIFSVNKLQTRFYNNKCVPINHDLKNLIPTQDLEPYFEENSNLYIFSKMSFNASSARIGKDPMMIESSKIESLDIDTPEDWELAELIAWSLINRQKKTNGSG